MFFASSRLRGDALDGLLLLSALQERAKRRRPFSAYEDEPVVVSASHLQKRLRLARGGIEPLAVRIRNDVVFRAVDDQYGCAHLRQARERVVAKAADQAHRQEAIDVRAEI